MTIQLPPTKKAVDLTVTAPQAEFLALDCRYPAFVGGYGSGKSETMTTAAVMDAGHSSSAVIAMYEPTFDLVTLMLAPRMENKLQQFGIRYNYNKQDHIIYTSNSQFGDFVFRSLDKPERIIAYESYRAHVDELDTLSTEHAQEAWRKILGRNRQCPKDLSDANKIKNKVTGELEVFNRASVYTTPEGFRFVYNRWKKNKTSDYGMVHASTRSNPFNDPSYVKGLLEEYPAELANAYIEGQFTNLTSGTVYNAYNRHAHNSNERVRDGETLHIGCDFNIKNMAFTVYVKRNGGLEWHAVDEGHDIYDTFEMVEVIKKRYPSNQIIMYPDASGARSQTSSKESDHALLRAAGFFIRAPKKNPYITDRVNAMNKAFYSNTVFINELMCPTVASCLENQAWKNGEPDKTSGNDHQNDATTYPIAHAMPVKSRLFNIDISFMGRE